MKTKALSISGTALLLLMAGVLAMACAPRQIIVPPVAAESGQPYQTGKFVWFDLFTSDIATAKHFYEQLFGWRFEVTVDGEDRVRTITRDGHPIANAIEIKEPMQGPRESRWLGYISVGDVDTIAQWCAENQASIYIPPRDLPDRGRIAVIKDPQGAIFGVLTATGGDGDDMGLTENAWMGSELWAIELDSALAFYSGMIGYEVKKIDTGSTSEYHFLAKDDRIRAGIVQMPWEARQSEWLPYIAVRDAAAFTEQATLLGGKLVIAPDLRGSEGRVAIIADPTGAVFAIQQIKPMSDDGGNTP